MSDVNPGLVLATVVMAVACVGILAVAVIAIVIDRRDQRPAKAYVTGWVDCLDAALELHGPGHDQPEARLQWVIPLAPPESTPYGYAP